MKIAPETASLDIQEIEQVTPNSASSLTTTSLMETKIPVLADRPDELANILNIQASPATKTESSVTAPTVSTYNISPSVHNPNWNQAISQRIVWMSQNKLQSASLTLNPPNLGPVQVTVHINNQQATVQFISAQAEVRDALQNALPMLDNLFAEAGIQLEHSDVSSHNQNPDPRQPPRSNQGIVDNESVQASVSVDSLRTTSGNGLINIAV